MNTRSFQERWVAGLRALALAGGVLGLGLAAQGATSVVTEATEAALRAGMAGGGTVSLACDGTITLSNGIVVATDTVLDGTRHAVTITGTQRAFIVSTNVSFGVLALAISNCEVPQPPNDTLVPASEWLTGGGILNQGGTVDLNGVTFQQNYAVYGGAIANCGGGAVNATNCTFYGNSATFLLPPMVAYWGYPAYGGAIANQNGAVTLQSCLFSHNSAWGGSDNPMVGHQSGSAAGSGGAIGNLAGLTVSGCTFENNGALGGSGFTWSLLYGPFYGYSGTPGAAGYGGAIYNTGTLALWGSTLANNEVSGGSGGSGQVGFLNYTTGQITPSGGGGKAASGFGGGVFNGGEASAVNCTFYANSAVGGAGGQGGASFSYSGLVDGFHVSGTEPAGPDGSDGSGLGGAAGSTGGWFWLTNCTIAFNTASAQTNDAQAVGGLSLESGTLVNTLLTSNAPGGNGSGAVFDGGGNLSSDDSCGFTAPSSRNNTDPLLGPLANLGGATLTMALLAGSPAIGAADSALAPPTDQRGYPRPPGSADIGACEYGYPPLVTAARVLAAGAELSVSGRPGQACWLLASPDLVDWTAVGTNQFSAAGTALFQDAGAVGQARRFYRVTE